MSALAVSVLMAVFNGAPWVEEAIRSVLGQTARDLEVIVIDDGSTDATPAILGRMGDPRLRVTRRERAGLTRSLNHAFRLARGALIARLDADDLALPDRLERQCAFLAAHDAVGLLGTGARVVDETGRTVREIRPPADDAAIRRALIRRNPFVHSSVVVRRSVLERVGGYDEALAVAQDYDLWMRASRITRLANIPEPLVVRRLVTGRVGASRDDERLRTEARVRWRAVRSGAYPPWCAIFAARPLLALALPGPWRRAVRRAAGLGDHRASVVV